MLNDSHSGDTKSDRVKHLQRQIEELKQRWPAHSVTPTMLQELDELEDELEKELAQAKQD